MQTIENAQTQIAHSHSRGLVRAVDGARGAALPEASAHCEATRLSVSQTLESNPLLSVAQLLRNYLRPSEIVLTHWLTLQGLLSQNYYHLFFIYNNKKMEKKLKLSSKVENQPKLVIK